MIDRTRSACRRDAADPPWASWLHPLRDLSARNGSKYAPRAIRRSSSSRSVELTAPVEIMAVARQGKQYLRRNQHCANQGRRRTRLISWRACLSRLLSPRCTDRRVMEYASGFRIVAEGGRNRAGTAEIERLEKGHFSRQDHPPAGSVQVHQVADTEANSPNLISRKPHW